MTKMRLLFIDDDSEALEELTEFFEEHSCRCCSDFSEALDVLRVLDVDVVIADVRDDEHPNPENGNHAGRKVFEALKAHQFVPVVFYTGIPKAVEDLAAGDIVTVVPKGASLSKDLEPAIRAAFESGVSRVNRALRSVVRETSRDYMWEFIVPKWPDLLSELDEATLARIVCRRLSQRLDESSSGLLDGLGAASSPVAFDHPASMYIYPPFAKNFVGLGDLIHEPESDRYWMVLTPTCDTVGGGGRVPKVDRLLLAACEPLTQRTEYLSYLEGGSNSKRKALKKFLEGRGGIEPSKSQENRYYFLPGIHRIPDMVVDLAALESRQFDGTSAVQITSTLQHQYAAKLLTQFKAYFGRFGVADIDLELVVSGFAITTTD